MDSGDFGIEGIVYLFGEFVLGFFFIIDLKLGKIIVNNLVKLDWEIKKKYKLMVIVVFYRDLCINDLFNDFFFILG